MKTFHLVAALCFVTGWPAAYGQGIFGKNLIVNGDAEAGPGNTGSTPGANIPGWNRTGAADVLAYASAGSSSDTLTADGIAPANHGNNYFAGGRAQANSSLTQTIDLTPGASTISPGTATFAASAYLGGALNDEDNASVTIAFQDATGKQLAAVTLGPVNSTDRDTYAGLYFRRQIGLVPAAAAKAVVTLSFNYVEGTTNDAYADNVSLVLNAPASAQSLMNSNLLVNPGADASLGYMPDQPGHTSPDLPGWVRSAYFAADSYQDTNGDLDPTSTGPSDRGANYFYGGDEVTDSSNPIETAYQDIDVSSAAALIDTGKVTYTMSGWLGGYATQDDNCVITAQFQDWNRRTLGTAQLGPVIADDRNNVSSLVQRSTTGAVPAGTRVIHYLITMTRTAGNADDGLADSLSLVLSTPASVAPPVISDNGVITAGAFGGFPFIAPGTWIEIYGSNFAPAPMVWSGADFRNGVGPTSLGGVSVNVGGQPAYVDYISGGQVNALVPFTVGTGPVQVTVSNSAGTSNAYKITVRPTQPGVLAPPSFTIGGKQYVVATFADGTTYVLPPGANLGVPSRPAKPGDTIIMYGVGFGPVTPAIPAGTLVTQANTLANPLQILFGSTPASIEYQGLAPNYTGLYQFNVVVPSIPDNDAVPLQFTLGGVQGTQTLYTAVHQ